MKLQSQSASGPILHFGGYGQLIVVGDFNGNTVTVEAKFDADKTETWIPQDSTLGTPIELTGTKSVPFLASRGNIRIVCDDSGEGNPDIDWFIIPLPIYTNERG
jgi:hypothetical protein